MNKREILHAYHRLSELHHNAVKPLFLVAAHLVQQRLGETGVLEGRVQVSKRHEVEKPEEEDRVVSSLRVFLDYIGKNYRQTLARISSLVSHSEITLELAASNAVLLIDEVPAL